MNSQSLNILHITPWVGKGSTGLGSLSLDLARSQNDLGYDAQLWCLDDKPNLQWASALSGLRADRIRGFASTRVGVPGFSLEMERAAASVENRDVAVVHQHGLWAGVSRVTNVLRKVQKASTVVAPQGSLHRWALQRSWWKKKIALAFYESTNLNESSCLHAVSENEIRDCRDFGLRNPIAVIPNGVSRDWLNSRGAAEAFRHRFGIPDHKRVLLFLSRVSPKKGLLMLLEAVHNIEKDFADWELVIAGADEFGHQAEVESCIRQRGLTKYVRIVGPLFDQAKRDAYAAADLFVLPSFSEGAPVVILEALGAEVPVLATKASPWQELETYGCGWWVDIGTAPLSDALKDAVRRSPEDLKMMGRQGRELVASRYSWTTCAQMTIELYEWLLRRKQRPGFVVTE